MHTLDSCQSRFSGMYLVFEVFWDAWRSNKENPSVYWNATLSCRLTASNYANSYLVPISFWSRSRCWPCLGLIIHLALQACISFCTFQAKVAHLCFCLVRKNAVSHVFETPYDRTTVRPLNKKRLQSQHLHISTFCQPFINIDQRKSQRFVGHELLQSQILSVV